MTYGSFERSFRIPIPIDPEGVKARYLDGVLEVQLPRFRPRARRIPVKALREDQD
jgi:HSP20 family protein